MGKVSFLRKVRSPKRYYYLYYLYSFLFIINCYSIRNMQIKNVLWYLIRNELFYVDGKCESTGNCCRKMAIYSRGKKIESLDSYQELVKKKPKYKIFKPVYQYQGIIKHFKCSNLTEENVCKDYDNRPDFCKTYPYNLFLKTGGVFSGCGYSVRKTNINPIILNKNLKSLIDEVLYKNDLI